MAATPFIILADARVFRTTSKAHQSAFIASLTDDERTGAVVATDADMSAIPTKTLVALFNAAQTEVTKPITRFADRKTAEKRMNGVLDLLAKDAPKVEGAVAEKAPKQPKAPKVPGEPKADGRAKPIPQDELDEVVRRRTAGEDWTTIRAAMGNKPVSWIHRVRPLLKTIDATMVKPLGPGSATYGTRKDAPKPERKPRAPKEAKAPRAKKTSSAPQEEF